MRFLKYTIPTIRLIIGNATNRIPHKSKWISAKKSEGSQHNTAKREKAVQIPDKINIVRHLRLPFRYILLYIELIIS